MFIENDEKSKWKEGMNELIQRETKQPIVLCVSFSLIKNLSFLTTKQNILIQKELHHTINFIVKISFIFLNLYNIIVKHF